MARCSALPLPGSQFHLGESVSLLKDSEFGSKHIRAGVRVNSRIPLGLSWLQDGHVSQVEGYTMDISAYGCMAIAPRDFVLGQKMRLVNMVSHKECDAIVVWRGQQQAGIGCELGLQLQNPTPDFWELDF